MTSRHDTSYGLDHYPTTAIGYPALALFCSRKCPGSVILRAYDLAVALRDAAVPVIGGFQTPMEREMLAVLLRGTQPVVVVDARNARKRLPPDWERPHEDGRLRILSPFDADRPTTKTAEERNRLVVSLAAQVLIVHAALGGRTEALAHDAVASGKPLYTLATDDDANANLIVLGAAPIGARFADWPVDLVPAAPVESVTILREHHPTATKP